MLKQTLLKQFNNYTTGKNLNHGRRVYSNELLTKKDINIQDELLIASAKVLSEGYLSEYTSKIEFDKDTLFVVSTYCTCSDYEKNELIKNNYACKHIVATFLAILDELDSNKELYLQLSKEETKNTTIFKNKKDDIVDFLLKDKKVKDEIKLDVYLNKAGYKEKIYAEFKIGLKGMASNKLYSLKDIDAFLAAIHNNYPVKYGKDFTFDISNQRLSVKDRDLVDFIEMLKRLQGNGFVKRDEKFIDGKRLFIPPYFLRDFLLKIKGYRVFLNDGFYLRPVDADILLENPPLELALRADGNSYKITKLSHLPENLNGCDNIFLSGTNIYLSSLDFKEGITPFMELFRINSEIVLPKSREKEILTELIPKLKELAFVNISKDIKENIISAAPEFIFYFDREGKEVKIDLHVKYEDIEFNIFFPPEDKVIYRDNKKEQEIIEFIKELGFDKVKGSFYFFRDESLLFEVLKYDIEQFNRRGKVFYSENFKGIKKFKNDDIQGKIRPGRNDYLEFDFKVGNLSNDEIYEIYYKLKTNPKFFRLKSGEFIDLENIMLKEYINLIGSTISKKDIKDNIALIKRGRADYFQKIMKEKELRFIKGKNELKKITSKLQNLDKISFPLPKDINATLRGYQEIGYNWFKTLDYLEFGGVLADEMGLGKTIQAISFISSEKNKKTLIVAPTSLIYNWENEFNKFTPFIKVAVMSGDKQKRENTLNHFNEYDVFITTYNLLRRDIELYKDLQFDFMIIDEAQYIKNSKSKNAEVCKKINSKRRFALTGTPIENSLMELWSIFDFIMPGYLFDEQEFETRYHRRLQEDEVLLKEVQRLTKPFILRRLKKDVIKELPDKITKKIDVVMSDEQQRVYASYAEAAKKVIQEEIQDRGFGRSKLKILSFITRLRQLCLDPKMILNDYTGESCKVEALIEILHQSIDSGHKVLVFSQFTSALKIIKERLIKENITFSYLDGGTKTLKRVEMVDEFNNGTNEVFLISLKAGGTGLNLTSADVVIHFDPWWNPAVEDQATDRAHRIGQESVVEVIKLISKGTIEERIIQLQDSKRELISTILSDELSSPKDFNKLTEDDILSLFN